MSQTCSIELRSGENGGHVRRLIPLLDVSAFVARALCEGALSCISKRDRWARTFPCVSDNICWNGTQPCVSEREIPPYLLFYQGHDPLTVFSRCYRPPIFFPEKERPFLIPRKRSPEHPATRAWWRWRDTVIRVCLISPLILVIVQFR